MENYYAMRANLVMSVDYQEVIFNLTDSRLIGLKY
jgi:hypothetical protein